jgi:hypothetical protein
VLVLNLGLNGGLPADQLRLLELIDVRNLDLLVSTLSIRSFATDFATRETALSRPWLSGVARRSGGGCAITQPRGNRFDRVVRKQASRVSVLFGAADFVQRLVFDDSLRDATARWISRMRAGLSTATAQAASDDSIASDMAVLLLARGRFHRISFVESNAQVAAMRAFVARAPQIAKNVVFIYGNESRRRLVSLISRRDYDRHRTSLANLIQTNCHTLYIADFRVPDALYVDYVHVNSEGYHMMADAIVRALSQPHSC